MKNPNQTPNKTQTPNLEKVQTFVPSLSEKEAQKVARALGELEKASNNFNLKTLNYGKDAILNYANRSKILDFIKEQTKLKYDELSKLTNISISYLKSFAQLSKAINNAEEGKSIDTFLTANSQRIANQKPANYTIYGLISYLKGEDIFAEKENKVISDKEEAKEQTKGAKAQTKAQTSEPKQDANRQTFVFNPLLFGFEAKEDITLNIVHNPKNKAKKYLITSNVSSAVLRSMFERILFECSRCERDAETIAKFEIETETELADNVTLDTFESEFIQVRR